MTVNKLDHHSPPTLRAGRPARVLHLAIYPSKVPMHGGQVRVRSIVDALEACQCVVDTLAVYGDFQFPAEQRGNLDVVISSSEFNDAYFAEPLFADLTTASFLLARPALMDVAVTRIASFSPDVIILEQPFLLPLVEAAQRIGVKAKVVYSSQNDEAALKRILVMLDNGPGSRDHGLIDTVADLEKRCLATAQRVISISDEEASTLRMAGVDAMYVPACSPLNFNSGNRAPRNPTRTQCKYVVFAASSYWLNVDGFFDIFNDGLGFLRPDEHLVIVGSGCDAIFRDPRFDRRRGINESRCTFRGFLPKEELVEVYLGAQAIIIPVTRGAGSNLKTADALAAGRPVISTAKGLAGYRSMLVDALDNGVYEAPTPLDFKRRVRAAVRGELRSPTPALSRCFQREHLYGVVSEMMDSLGSIS